MKARNAKVTAVLLACFLGMTAVGCSGDKETSSKQSDKDSSTAGISAATLPVETDEKGETVTDASGQPVLASGATDFMVKEIEFTWGAKNNTADADTQDPTEAPTAAQANANGQTVTSYVAVTDDGGNKVVDDNGKVVTELVTVPAPQGGEPDKPDFEANYAFAVRATQAINAQADGLCRDVLVRTGRYNQHVGTPAVLIEVGHNENTLNQALASMPYLADGLLAGLRGGAS